MTLDFLAHLRAESARFAEVLRDTDPAARVPSCPDWDADDLLWHLGEVFLFWGTIVRDRLDNPDAAEDAKPERPADHTGLLELYDRAAADLIATLTETPDDVRVWTWSDDQSAGFVRRRMAQEALIHRLDAELTAGAVTDIDADFATDGAHEALQHFCGGCPPWASYHADGPLGRVRTTDTGADWLVQLGGFSGLSPNTGKTYDHEPCLEIVAAGEPTFTVSATGRDLDAWLWNRPAIVEPVVEGSEADFQAFAAIIAKGVD
jgi:uncharacterized protein (TIGR03083 family)